MRESPYRILEEALRPHLGARAQVVLEEGLKRLGKRPEELSEKDAETLLKGLIFRELQARLPAAQARRAVEEALARLAPAPEGAWRPWSGGWPASASTWTGPRWEGYGPW